MLSSATLLVCLLVVTRLIPSAYSLASLSQLLKQHQGSIQKLKDTSRTTNTIAFDDVMLLRYCLSDDEDPVSQYTAACDWYASERGNRIASAARTAVQEATSTGSWNNEAILTHAPQASVIGTYLTPAACVTTTASNGDLVYCIRAGSIEDKQLMQALPDGSDGLVDFFLYAKEVNALVANQRSVEQDRLVSIITCNDLSGVKLVGGSAEFRSALSESSKLANQVYPTVSLAGPTLLLNLPTLLSALVKLFTPLFPEPVKKRLKFKQGLLKNVTDLREIATAAKTPQRNEFLKQLDAILQE